MKKLLAFFLILATLLPMTLVVQAAPEQAEKMGFYMVNWEGTETQQPNVYDLPFFWVNGAYLKSGNILGCVWCR